MARCLTLTLLALLVHTASFAQAVGASVSGIVSDESGARLPGVAISITNVSNGRSQTLISGAHGEYRAVALQPAPYHIAVDLSGFARSEHDVTLAVGSDARRHSDRVEGTMRLLLAERGGSSPRRLLVPAGCPSRSVSE